jgi:predicted nucleic acid-binding protein
MKDKVFLDTNIIVYLYSDDEPKKRLAARRLIVDYDCYISTQVLQEFTNVSRKKYKVEWKEINLALAEVTAFTSLFTNELATIKYALAVAEKTKYSFYDSLIISSALAINCQILFTEDMHHSQLIEKKLKIVNPFL